MAGYLAVSRKCRRSIECVVAHTVDVEPVSIFKFPDNRENAGNFREIQPWAGLRALSQPRLPGLFYLNSLLRRAGNFLAASRELRARTCAEIVRAAAQ
jgi:hypothetical protein